MAQPKLSAAILIVSDTASADPTTDRCIPVLREVFADQATWSIADTQIVPDDTARIQEVVKSWIDRGDAEEIVNCVVTSGGTGFAVKDNTPEAISELIQKFAPGLVHAMLAPSLAITPFAMMARPVAGVRNKTIIITLPGSPKGAKENLEAIIKLLPHACQQAAGVDSRALHEGGVEKLEKEAGVGAAAGSDAPKADKGTTHSYSHGHHHHHHHHHHGHGGHAAPRAHTISEELPPTANEPSLGPSRRYRKSPYPLLSVTAALDLIKEHTPPPEAVTIPVDEKLIGHVLAEDVTAPESVPAFRASIVDGYAVRFPSGSDSFPKGVYPVALISHANAGSASGIPELQEGSIARITTGAPLPPGADAVIMVEDTLLASKTDDGLEEREIEILTSAIARDENVRAPGSDVTAGSIILRAGQTISGVGGEFGLLASTGVARVAVFRKPTVGVLSTGDELVDATERRPLTLGEVRDTNRPALLTALRGHSYDAVDLGIVRDASGSLETALRSALRRVDVLLTTGGVSMGELDLLKPTLQHALGATIRFGRVAMKPGKPTTFATVPFKDNAGSRARDRLVFALPGNPASAVTTWHLFVLPALHVFAGVRKDRAGCARVSVVLDEDVRRDAARAEYVRVVITSSKPGGGEADGRLYALSTGGQRSSRIGSFASANGLLCLPAEQGVASKGSTVEALLMGPIVG